ncbi:hypothetical protein OIU78_010933 [Salix suchowensis]|nr:hypothetical protein OIU78_010933 [Salix suchowensis]
MGAYASAQNQWTAGYGSQPQAWPPATQVQTQQWAQGYNQQAAYGAYTGYGGSYANPQAPTVVAQGAAYGGYPPTYPAQSVTTSASLNLLNYLDIEGIKVLSFPCPIKIQLSSLNSGLLGETHFISIDKSTSVYLQVSLQVLYPVSLNFVYKVYLAIVISDAAGMEKMAFPQQSYAQPPAAAPLTQPQQPASAPQPYYGTYY